MQLGWATTGMGTRNNPNSINTLQLQPEKLEEVNAHLQAKYALLQTQETRSEEIWTDDAELVVVAYGISSRIALSAVKRARDQGLKVGLFRPITLWPFPKMELANAVKKTSAVMVVELSSGQMIEDVNLAIRCSKPVYFQGRTGGMMMKSSDIYDQILQIIAPQGGN